MRIHFAVSEGPFTFQFTKPSADEEASDKRQVLNVESCKVFSSFINFPQG